MKYNEKPLIKESLSKLSPSLSVDFHVIFSQNPKNWAKTDRETGIQNSIFFKLCSNNFEEALKLQSYIYVIIIICFFAIYTKSYQK
jgi:hypothetical protein